MSSFEKFSNRFFMFGKKSQNLKIFLLERELFHEIDQISIQTFKKSRVLEKKLSSFEKFPNRFFMLGKKSQNLKIFFLERELFHEIDQISIHIFKKSRVLEEIRQVKKLKSIFCVWKKISKLDNFFARTRAFS